MRNPTGAKVFVLSFSLVFFAVEASVSAGAPKTQSTGAQRVEQVFAQTSSEPIRVGGWGNPPPDTAVLAQMTVDPASSSLLIITFSATVATGKGTVQPTITCKIDTLIPCEPRQVYFLASDILDSRSFTWIVHKASKGKHKVTISASWLPARPTPPVTFYNRTLVIEAARI